MVQAVGTCKGSSKNDDCAKVAAISTWEETIQMLQNQSRLSDAYAKALKDKILSVANKEK